MTRYALQHLGIICALGNNCNDVARRLFDGDISRMGQAELRTTAATVPAGWIHEALPQLPGLLARFNCRNHRIAYAAFLQIEDHIKALRQQYGAHRIGVVLGSSTAGIDATEKAFQVWQDTGKAPDEDDYSCLHAMGSVARFVAEAAEVTGPAYTVSTACTSGSKAMISARSLLDLDLCDVVITGGVDTLCELTLNGFEALSAVSHQPTIPMSANRTGLNIGEGAALFTMTRGSGPIELWGAGESCDAWHMSAPHPEGIGAEASMRLALEDAGVAPEEIDYVNLHGTGTKQNDSMEALAVHRIFGPIPCSSSKPMVGHTLGAAGAIEAAFCWLSLNEEQTTLPPHVYDNQYDPEFPQLDLVGLNRDLDKTGPIALLSNSFAFGGNNCSLVIGRSGGV